MKGPRGAVGEKQKRCEYEMTQEQLDKLTEACQPVPYMVFGDAEPRGPRERAMDFWSELGKEMGFDFMTASPIPGKGPRFFTAVPTLEV